MVVLWTRCVKVAGRRAIIVAAHVMLNLGSPDDFVRLAEEVGERCGAELLALASDLLPSPGVALHAVELALRAFAEGRNRARKLALEAMLYAACTTQIKDALRMMAPRPGPGRYFVIAVSYRPGAARCALSQALRELGAEHVRHEPDVRRIMEAYRVPEALVRASMVSGRERIPELLEKIILERMALLDAQK